MFYIIIFHLVFSFGKLMKYRIVNATVSTNTWYASNNGERGSATADWVNVSAIRIPLVRSAALATATQSCAGDGWGPDRFASPSHLRTLQQLNTTIFFYPSGENILHNFFPYLTNFSNCLFKMQKCTKRPGKALNKQCYGALFVSHNGVRVFFLKKPSAVL